jgi:hypothetical protein
MDIYNLLNELPQTSNKTVVESPIEFININQSILILENKTDISIGETGNSSNDYYHVDQSKILDHNDREYNKKWYKLDKQQKINRLMNYINTTEIIGEHPEPMRMQLQLQLQLQSLLVDLVMNKCIKSFCVEYCEIEGKIKAIPDLKYNYTTSCYYVGTDIRDISITTLPKPVSMKPFKELNLKEMFAPK